MNDRHFKNFIIGIGLGASGFAFAAVTLPNTFSAGTPIVAAQVNANFAALKTALETAGGINDGAIAVGKLSVTGTAADGKVLKLSGGTLAWGDDAVGAGGSTYTAGAGLGLTGTTFSVKFPLTGTISATDAGSIGFSVTSSDPSKTAIKGLGGNYGVVGDTLSPNGVGVLAANSGAADGAALEVSGGIKVSGASKPAFVHITTTANTLSNYTCIDNPLTNNKPNAVLIVTPNFYNPSGASGLFPTDSLGVFYGNSTGIGFSNKWCIFNQGGVVVGSRFNILVFNQ
jgi:hypothetical protein